MAPLPLFLPLLDQFQTSKFRKLVLAIRLAHAGTKPIPEAVTPTTAPPCLGPNIALSGASQALPN